VKSRCHGAELHVLDFVVQPLNVTALRDLAMDRTNPASPNYRHWLSREEVVAMTRNDAGLSALRVELSQHDGVEVLHESIGGDFLKARAPIRTWESLLEAKFYSFEHPDAGPGRELLRSLDYALPDALKAHVGGIINILDFDAPPDHVRSEELNATGVESNAKGGLGYPSYEALARAKGPSTLSPPKLRRIYEMPEIAERGSEQAKQHLKTTQVVYGTLNQHWSPSDRTIFEATFGIPQDNYVRQLKGQEEGHAMSGDERCRTSPQDCTEANLDVQYIMAMSPWSKVGYWYVPQATATGLATFLTDFMATMADGDENPPQVISISYGMPEASVPKDALFTFEVFAMKLTLQGVTIFVASGDDGAATFLARRQFHGQDCLAVKLLGLQAMWPASSQWVTGVGATIGPASSRPEVVCQPNFTGIRYDEAEPLITSGGGYSQAFQRPVWQDGRFGQTGRGVPDVALVGHAYAVVLGGEWVTFDGTSAPAPVLAGMLSLINSELLAAGRPSVGFLNQLIYSKAAQERKVFNDITKGDNRCGARGYPCCGGYDATEGWDPVTGLGSLSWQKLRDLIFATGH